MLSTAKMLRFISFIVMLNGLELVTGEPLPGVLSMSRAYNMLSGQTIIEQDGNEIFYYTYSDGRVTEGYAVPDQFKSNINPKPECSIDKKVSELFESSSTSVAKLQSSETSLGYSQTIDVGVELEYEGIPVSASTTITNELMFGWSSTSGSTKTHDEDSYSYSFLMTSMVSWYQAAIDWGRSSRDNFNFNPKFKEAINTLNTDAYRSSKAVLSFINDWGSHVMSAMRAGVSCRETAYISKSNYMDKVVEFRQNVFDFSFKYEFFQITHKDVNQENRTDTYTNGVSYSFNNIRCDGEAKGNSMCGKLHGDTNRPVPVSYGLVSIFEIEEVANILGSNMYYIKQWFKNLYKSLNQCRNDHCSGHGTCSLDRNIWSSTFVSNWNGDFSKLLYPKDSPNSKKCTCEPWRIGEDCGTCLRVPSGHTYLGCWKDDSKDRAFPNYAGSGYNIERCYKWAVDKGYSYFSLQATNQCFGGGDMDKIVKKHEKSDNCQGGLGIKDYANAVYAVKKGEYWSHLGCYQDNTFNRALPYRFEGDYTIDACMYLAKDKGYSYFGMQFGHECWAARTKAEATKYGTNNDCHDGLGGGSANDVYLINQGCMCTFIGWDAYDYEGTYWSTNEMDVWWNVPVPDRISSLEVMGPCVVEVSKYNDGAHPNAFKYDEGRHSVWETGDNNIRSIRMKVKTSVTAKLTASATMEPTTAPPADCGRNCQPRKRAGAPRIGRSMSFGPNDGIESGDYVIELSSYSLGMLAMVICLVFSVVMTVIMCKRSARKHVVYRKVVMHSESDIEAERVNEYKA